MCVKMQRKHANSAPQIMTQHHQPPMQIETSVFQLLASTTAEHFSAHCKSIILPIIIRKGSCTFRPTNVIETDFPSLWSQL